MSAEALFDTTTNPKRTLLKFVEKINEHDVEALTSLMSERHVFVDPLGNVVNGREKMRDGQSPEESSREAC